MIQLPQRSVTRFFIPMIDVLTLLLCIYLLMPMVDSSGDAESEVQRGEREERLRSLEAELKRMGGSGEEAPAKLREEIERLRKEKIQVLKNRLAVRVLEIDPSNGHLQFRDPDKVDIRDQVEAQRLIENDRQAQGVSRRELYYLVLYPRDRTSGYPTREQRQHYDRWFDGVAVSYDIPGVEPGKEN